MKKSIIVIVIVFNCILGKAQEHFKHFRVSPIISHTFIPVTTIKGNETIVVPSFGLDLEYWASHKWGFGFHNDIELETFEIEKEHELFIKKEFPIVVTFDALYKFKKNWIIVVGAGVEFEKNENLFVIRTGLEYEVEFGNHWDVAPTVFYDYRSNKTGTYAIGIGIGKRF